MFMSSARLHAHFRCRTRMLLYVSSPGTSPSAPQGFLRGSIDRWSTPLVLAEPTASATPSQWAGGWREWAFSPLPAGWLRRSCFPRALVRRASSVVYILFGGCEWLCFSLFLEIRVDSKVICWLCSEKFFRASLLRTKRSWLVGLASDPHREPDQEQNQETRVHSSQKEDSFDKARSSGWAQQLLP